MNKSKNIIALALSVSFFIDLANVYYADETNSDITSYVS